MKIKWARRPEICIQITGQLYWTCPECAHVNRNRLSPGSLRVRCTNGECGKRFMVGINLCPVAFGGKSRGEPPDAYVYARLSEVDLPSIQSQPAQFTGEVFGKGVLRDKWESGKFVNTVEPRPAKRK